MKSRIPQLALRLEADAPGADACWHAGADIAYLGATLKLILDTTCREPTRIAAELHLPLPPAATSRQIRDTAESWLRDEALRSFRAIVAQKSAQPLRAASGLTASLLAGRQPPHGVGKIPVIALVFGKRSDWVRREGETLRCHWRLIEQAPAIIEQVLGSAVAQLRPTPVCDDLFALV
jgi:hypothetical protein